MASKRRIATVALLLVTGVGALGIGALSWLRRPRYSPAERGRHLFAKLGCTACHGDGAAGGVFNPNSQEREIPGFIGGTAMMYVKSEEEIREWILDGRPARLKRSLAGAKALLAMPSYRKHISKTQLNDLVAYYKAVAVFYPQMRAAIRKGYTMAGEAGCFGCHGPGGRLGAQNPGSFKGYVPGWGSEDFFDLVRNEDELRQWINDGVVKRLADSMVAQYFFRRQLLSMPAYRKVLSAKHIEGIVAYVSWAVGWRK